MLLLVSFPENFTSQTFQHIYSKLYAYDLLPINYDRGYNTDLRSECYLELNEPLR